MARSSCYLSPSERSAAASPRTIRSRVCPPARLKTGNRRPETATRRREDVPWNDRSSPAESMHLPFVTSAEVACPRCDEACMGLLDDAKPRKRRRLSSVNLHNIKHSPRWPDGYRWLGGGRTMTTQQRIKKCSHCNRAKIEEEFAKDKNRKDGRYPHCKACTAEARSTRAVIDHGECAVEGCSQRRRSRNIEMCNMHYRRLLKRGDIGPATSLVDTRDTTCSYCGAPGKIIHDSTYEGGGLCEIHQGRWRRNRDLGARERLTSTAPADGQCTNVSEDGEKCSGAYVAAGLCAMHYQRVAAGRSVNDPGIDIRIDPREADADMRRAGAEPLAPYVRSVDPWRCTCLTCGRTITPTLESVRRGKHPCWYCSGSRTDPQEAVEYMLNAGMRPLVPWPGRVDRKWKGIHVGTSETPGCLGEIEPTYHSVKTHRQGVCFDCGIRGYSRAKPGTFYVVRNATIVKGGIANMRGLARRLSTHKSAGLHWNWLIGFEDGSVAWNLERQWKAFRLDHPELHVQRHELKDGYTEAVKSDHAVDKFLLGLAVQLAVE